MYKKIKPSKTTIKVNNSYEGESLEEKVDRLLNNGEPIGDNVELQYTERKDGVPPQFDVRTDKFELAVEESDKVHQAVVAGREAKIVEMKEAEKKKNDGGPESTQATDKTV